MGTNTHKFLSIGAIAAAGLGSAQAEPITAHFPAQISEFEFQDTDPGLPPIKVSRLVIDLGGGGGSVVTTHVKTTDGFACPPPSAFEPVSAYELQAAYARLPELGFSDEIGDSTKGWQTADFLCDFFQNPYSILTVPPGDFVCSDCEQSLLAFGSPLQDGVAILPIRSRLIGQADWNYGWVAVEIVTGIADTDCTPVPECGGGDTGFYDDFFFIGFGMETIPGMPINAGGGLCEADLNPDGLLDFDDVEAFIIAFTSAGSAGDFNGDGSFDLSDIVLFVTAFNTRCGIL